TRLGPPLPQTPRGVGLQRAPASASETGAFHFLRSRWLPPACWPASSTYKSVSCAADKRHARTLHEGECVIWLHSILVSGLPVQHAEEVQDHDHAERDAEQPKQKIAGHFVLSPSNLFGITNAHGLGFVPG